MPGRPKKSCDKCKSQKLRCSGNRPSCIRCTRLRRKCVYADPLASTSQSGTRSNGQSLTRCPRKESPGLLDDERSYLGIPLALLHPLIDLYFSHIYNASLLLHRPSLLKAVATQSVRPDILLSICSLAAKFYQDLNWKFVLIENGLAYKWAEKASKLAFEEAESPREENIVVFVNLSLFWYSMGQFRRSSMHECCAANTAFLLGLSKDRHGDVDSLTAEVRRRRFWACYIHGSFQTRTLFPTNPTDEMSNLFLPCRESDYNIGKPQDLVTLKSGRCNGSIGAEIVRVMALWSSVVSSIKEPELDIPSRLTAIQIVDARIHTYWSNLPADLRLDDQNSLSKVGMEALQGIILLNIVYHQCLCALHSSIVPLFSWSKGDWDGAYARQLSAQAALDHANDISSLLRATLKLSWDFNKMPSFLGYAAYCACAIQMPFLWCASPEVKQQAHMNVVTNLNVILIIGKIWKFVQLLGSHARRLYEIHALQPLNIPDEPKNISASILNEFRLGSARTRLSILAHNHIAINGEGVLANRIEDVDDVGLGNTATSTGSSGYDESSISQLISQITSDEPFQQRYNPIVMDPIPFDSLTDLYNLDNPGSAFGMDQPELLDEWIDQLMHHISS